MIEPLQTFILKNHTTRHFSFVETQAKATTPLTVSSRSALAKMSSSILKNILWTFGS